MIGIVGGIGPYAGIDLLKKIFDNTNAAKDQEHLNVNLMSLSSGITDRTEYLEGIVKENPGIAIGKVLLKLFESGATVAGIPCNTAHVNEIFSAALNELKKSNAEIRVLHMINETVSFIAAQYPGISKVGVLSTTGTYNSGVYVKALLEKGFEAIIPTREMQEKTIHPAIYDPVYGIKTLSAPIHPRATKNILEGISFLKEQGAEVVIMGCTEIPLAITSPVVEELPMIDPTTVLARALINYINPGKLRK